MNKKLTRIAIIAAVVAVIAVVPLGSLIVAIKRKEIRKYWV